MAIEVTGEKGFSLCIFVSEVMGISRTAARMLIKQRGVKFRTTEEDPDPVTHKYNFSGWTVPSDPNFVCECLDDEILYQIQVGKRKWFGVSRLNLMETEEEPRKDILFISEWT